MNEYSLVWLLFSDRVECSGCLQQSIGQIVYLVELGNRTLLVSSDVTVVVQLPHLIEIVSVLFEAENSGDSRFRELHYVIFGYRTIAYVKARASNPIKEKRDPKISIDFVYLAVDDPDLRAVEPSIFSVGAKLPLVQIRILNFHNSAWLALPLNAATAQTLGIVVTHFDG